MPGAVFLSYASQDAESAKRICDGLRADGVEVWFDQSELRGGDAWDQKIRRQIKECALFVPIVSEASQARPEGYFRLEWRLADQRTHLMGRNKAFLMPICLGQTPDAGADVPDSFFTVQWTRLQHGESLQALVQRVRSLLGREGTSPTRDATPPDAGARQSAAEPPTLGNSIAVLAFSNLSNDADNEFFSDGISEELLNVLAKVPGLRVTARTSAFYFKGKNIPVPEIAQKLGVAFVVEGSVRKAGNRVRITAQLIKAADGFHVWSENFDRSLEDIFAVQDEIAGLIAKNLRLKLGAGSHAASTVNPEAYRLFLQGRAVVNREIPDDYFKAIQFLSDSLAIDGTSALTWSWLSIAYTMSGALGVLPAAEGFERGRQAAHKAIALDPMLASGHSALGCIMFAYDWDWDGSRRVLEKAEALAPGDSMTVSFLAQVAQAVGQLDRALELSRRGLELDPLNNLAGYVMGKSLFQAHRFEEMVKLGEHMVGLNPTGFYGWVFQAYGNLLQGRFAEANRAAEQTPRGFYKLVCLSHTQHALGHAEEAERTLGELKSVHGVSGAYQIAEIHAFRGEPELAFEWLDHAIRARDPGMTWLTNDAFFDAMRPDPRWKAILKRMKLPDDQIPFDAVRSDDRRR